MKKKKDTLLSTEINKLIEKYASGSFIYTYYSYLNKFKESPKDWQNLFEYIEFQGLENEIKEKINSFNSN